MHSEKLADQEASQPPAAFDSVDTLVHNYVPECSCYVAFVQSSTGNCQAKSAPCLLCIKPQRCPDVAVSMLSFLACMPQACVQLIGALADECEAADGAEAPVTSFMRSCCAYGKKHLEVVKRWGRFPHRNLGRPSTAAELEGIADGTIPRF
jgi:Bacterial protein of unknown function (DUF924)